MLSFKDIPSHGGPRMSKSFYDKVQPIQEFVPLTKRTPLHPYFTSQPSSLIQAYIKNFTQDDDVVMDLFGGSGTTIREAEYLNRKGVYVDLNPWSCFIAKLSTTKPQIVRNSSIHFQKIKSNVESEIQKLYSLSESKLKTLKVPAGFPADVRLPNNSDVKTMGELFTKRNAIALWTLKKEIKKIDNQEVSDFLLFIFSGILARASRTYWKDKANKGGGDSGIFKVYRYWIPKEPNERNVWELFESRYNRVCQLVEKDNSALRGQSRFICGTATNLAKVKSSSVDYIYTDPPYAKHIPYLDLSTMYNAALDFKVSDSMKNEEVIEGGEINRSLDEYIFLMEQSFAEACRVLKKGRWMTLVFTHKDPSVFDKIVNAAVQAGFEFVNAVPQDTKRPSFHKTNNSLSVIKGQMMMNFRKSEKTNQLSLLKNSQIEVEKFFIKEAKIMLRKAGKDGLTFSDIVHNSYSKMFSLGYVKSISNDFPNLFDVLSSNFEKFEKKREIFFRIKNIEVGNHRTAV